MRAGAAAVMAGFVALGGCSAEVGAEPELSPSTAGSSAPTPSPPEPTATPTGSAESRPDPEPADPEPVLATRGKPRTARLSIPALGLTGLRVVPYTGTPDDGPGTAIQNGGAAASPHGSGGLVGPGGVGNYLITGHRSSATAPFRKLPSLRIGSRVVVETSRHRLVYEVVRNQRTSFRSAGSLRAQSAAVPGRPGRKATRAMITLSTCATFEDHAAGNYWSDEHHNPEHRIEKIGVLTKMRPL